MAISTLAIWEASNIARDEFVEDLKKIITICPECKVVPPNIHEDFFSGDIICMSGDGILAERIIDTRSEWGLSLDTDSTGIGYSASDYTAAPASNHTASEYRASDYQGSE